MRGTRLLLLRHGTTDANVSGLFLGATDAALSAKGRAEANKLGKRLADQELTAIICSDLQRARDTAAAVATHHSHLELQVDARIREMHLGDLEGVPAKEVQTKYPELMQQWFTDPGNTRMPGENSESLGEVQARAWTAIEDYVQANSGQTIAAVSHTFCILSTLCQVLGMPLTQFRRMFIHRASITEIVWDKHGPVLRRFNDVAHLE